MDAANFPDGAWVRVRTSGRIGVIRKALDGVSRPAADEVWIIYPNGAVESAAYGALELDTVRANDAHEDETHEDDEEPRSELAIPFEELNAANDK